MENYTSFFFSGTSEDRIITKCTVTDQQKFLRRYLRVLETDPTILIDYTMSYTSKHTKVFNYPRNFQRYINNNKQNVTNDLNDVGLAIERIDDTRIQEPETPSPSFKPSIGQTFSPSDKPSRPPSFKPSHLPSVKPSQFPSSSPSVIPSDAPLVRLSFSPSGSSGTPAISSSQNITSDMPSFEPKSFSSKLIGTFVGASLAGSALIIFGALCWRRQRQTPPLSPDDVERNSCAISNVASSLGDDMSLVSSHNSLSSNDSLISTGSSVVSDTGDEYDETQNLADEFDKYKDQNLEKMRADVAGAVSNSDDMMGQALTKALMDDMHDDDTVESFWFGSMDSIEIEASVYCEVNDWLKKKEGVGMDERRDFMQQKLNKMVATVRQGAIGPQDASRIIHGSAAMLGLELAEDVPETALVVTGMRMKVSKRDVYEAFEKFGEIDGVAVSSNARGFGLVRYRSAKYAQRALDHFRTGEIVVQDVAVMIKLLKSDNL